MINDEPAAKVYYIQLERTYLGLLGPGESENGMAQFVGKVIGTQMMKTAKVEVTKMVLHPHVLKVCFYSPII